MHRHPVVRVEQNVPLSGYTTLGVGGPAASFAEAGSAEELRVLVDRARSAGQPLLLLGGGSNVLVSDAGFPGMVIRFADRHLDVQGDRVVAGAGVVWDDLVRATVQRGLVGIECLSGIPGWAGAAPIQNIGAYGHELDQTLASVEILDLHTGRRAHLEAAECGFGYRTSRFKTEWRDRFLVTRIELRLEPSGPPKIRYQELSSTIGPNPTPADVRDAVLSIRRRKSMVIDPNDPNRRSAGSFFTNPIVPTELADRVAATADVPMPRFPVLGGEKLSAAWLIERAGFEKGYGDGPAGLSTNHCLALINRGTATASDLVRLAARIRRAVRERFGVTLTPEPTFIGFERPTEVLLDEADAY